MADYLQPVGLWSKRFAIVAMIVVCSICAVVTAALINDMIERRSFRFQGKPLWIGALVVAVMTIASGWLAIRLLSGQFAANGVTVMPVWFIEVFGVLFLAGLVLVLVVSPESAAFGVPSAIGVAISMLLIRMQVRRRKRLQNSQSTVTSNSRDGSRYES